MRIPPAHAHCRWPCHHFQPPASWPEETYRCLVKVFWNQRGLGLWRRSPAEVVAVATAFFAASEFGEWWISVISVIHSDGGAVQGSFWCGRMGRPWTTLPAWLLSLQGKWVMRCGGIFSAEFSGKNFDSDPRDASLAWIFW